MQIVNPQDFDQQNQRKMDEGLLVRFYIKARPDSAETARQGRPVFKDTEYIEIRTPGKRDPIARPASGADIERFPRHYEAFKNRVNGEMVEGTPLTEWPHISRSMVEELSFFHVKTVEQLVSMSDTNAQQFMGINALRKKAKEWLEFAKEGKAAADLKEELQQRDDEIAQLKAAVMELQKPKRRVSKKKASRKKATAKKE